MINGHGNDPHNYPFLVETDFSSNVIYHGIPQSLLEHLSNHINLLASYPNPEASDLKKKMALHHGLAENQVVITNGSTEAFYLLAQLFRSKHSLIVIPAFSEYEDAARIHDHTISYVNNSGLCEDFISDANIVWMGNPNNPDGKTYSPDFIIGICNKHSEKTFIVDEAYDLLCEGFSSPFSDNTQPNNLIVIRSFTKAFSIPGIRLGYILAPATICEQINKIKMPWSVNALAIETGHYIIDHYEELVPNTIELSRQSNKFQNALKEIPQLKIIPSNCNFFLVKLENGKAADLKYYLLKEYGFLIRDAQNFKGLDESWFRLAINNEESNQKLTAAIKQWISTQ